MENLTLEELNLLSISLTREMEILKVFQQLVISRHIDAAENAFSERIREVTKLANKISAEISRREYKIQDKLFYSVENMDGKKVLHILGEVYKSDEGDGYGKFEFAHEYTEPENLTEYFLRGIYNCGNIYQGDMTAPEAHEYIENYFSGDPGVELDIFSCSEDTPCGNYWYDPNKDYEREVN